ncbi:trimeric LpxA-like protein [Polychaeton citri CBS 116435]|uniref:Dynactin subunit 6 n=1 Tax=Polychaeton citri CBS 116435 TaxID=1314669 RepID=A0A9P4UTK2_9PEZI|nr:trimeric LpxA-like protein [Polychaeton citri CBS 116435]
MATRPSSGRATSTSVVSSVKPPTSIHPSAVVAEKAQLVGTHNIEIGENTILHPYVKIRAEGGPVKIGRDVTISETAVVGLPADRTTGEEDEVEIEEGASIESGAEVMARCIGAHSIIEVKASIGKGAMIGKYCRIAPMTEIKAGDEIPDYTVTFGHDQRRMDRTLASNPSIRDARLRGHAMEIDLLKKLIPNAAEKWR